MGLCPSRPMLQSCRSVCLDIRFWVPCRESGPMRTSKFKPEEVVQLLSEAAAGIPVREICIRTGISEPTFYGWRARYEGLDAQGVRRLRELVQENSRLRSALSIRELEVEVLTAESKHAIISERSAHGESLESDG